MRRDPHAHTEFGLSCGAVDRARRGIGQPRRRGPSNREIADRLTVSVRTVEGHLYRACITLDISDREELAALIRSGTTG